MLAHIERELSWKIIFPELAAQLNNVPTMKVELDHFSGTARQVADRARTTIGLPPGDKEIQPEYMRKLYLCEHSPIRIQQYLIRIENIPYSIAMHFVRHHNGVIPFVSTGRDDRIDISQQESRDRDLIPVYMELMCNPQALINISRKRLCSCSHKNTIKTWFEVKSLMSQINEPLSRSMVKDCIYRGWCYEHKTCNYHLSNRFLLDLEDYRSGINPPKENTARTTEMANTERGSLISIGFNSYLPEFPGPEITALFICIQENHIILDYQSKLYIIPLKKIRDFKVLCEPKGVL